MEDHIQWRINAPNTVYFTVLSFLSTQENELRICKTMVRSVHQCNFDIKTVQQSFINERKILHRILDSIAVGKTIFILMVYGWYSVYRTNNRTTSIWIVAPLEKTNLKMHTRLHQNTFDVTWKRWTLTRLRSHGMKCREDNDHL